MTKSYDDFPAFDDPPMNKPCDNKRLQTVLEIVKGLRKVNWPNDLEHMQAFRITLRCILDELSKESQQDLTIEGEIIVNLAIFALSTVKLVPKECFTAIDELEPLQAS